MKTEADLPDDVLAAIHAGRKIEAIKLLREQRGLGLKEAKEQVDAYSAGLPPDEARQLREEGTGGRLVWIIILVAVAWAAYHYLS